MITVCLLFGGQNHEHEVSLTSAASVLKTIDHKRYKVIPIWITRQGPWYWIEDFSILTEHKSQLITSETLENCKSKPVVLDYAHSKKLIGLKQSFALDKPDVLFPILHGEKGEDGTIQGLFSLAGIPYVGSGVLASAMGLDKVTMKMAFSQNSLPMVPFLSFNTNTCSLENVKKQTLQLGYPCFVKPANGGSSVGIGKAANETELEPLFNKAQEIDRIVVIEKAIKMRELECGVLGNAEPQASVVGEIVSVNEFYDYEAKYLSDVCQTRVPADIPPEISKQIQELSISAFKSIGAKGLARVDFFWEEKTKEVFVNEINTLPGFTPMSMYPMLWQEKGVSYSQLIDRLIELALE